MSELTPGQAYWIGRWARALRTTTAPQIGGQMRDADGGRCAVGVLVDVLVMDGLANWDDCEDTARPLLYVAQRIGGKALVLFLGLATVMNDGHGTPFTEIADWVEIRFPAVSPVPVQEGVMA
ncbi:MAG: hypothetical protein H0U59_06125 [Gemmatimonadaceae bacterium]|nr:hypothetical protein [Gemmatimonadaceae bacterium]